MAAVAVAQDPTQTLGARWLEALTEARHRTNQLADILRELETVETQMAEYGMTVQADLGAIGNAARAAHRDVEEHREVHSNHVFALPH